MNRSYVVVGLVGGLLVACGGPAGRPGDEASTDDRSADAVASRGTTGTFVSLSDIHFDPFYDPALFAELMETDASAWGGVFEASTLTEIAPAGSDSNYNLLASALRAAREAAPDPDFVVVSGDFLAHGFQQSFRDATGALAAERESVAGDCRSDGRPPLQCFTDRTIEFVALMLRESFGEAPIYPVLGNNDSYCGDYEIDPVGPFVERTGATWSRRLIDAGNRASFDATFRDGGNYVVAPPASGGRIIALNTNLLSPHYRDACAVSDARELAPVGFPPRGAAADAATSQGQGTAARPVGAVSPEASMAQVRWLATQLEQAESAGEGALILYHIPAGTDVYATLKHGSTDTVEGVVGFWQTEYGPALLDIIAAYRNTIRGILAGHTHMDQYLLVPGPDSATLTFEHITPAISPMFGNNPAFKVFTYERGGFALLDYTTHYLPVVGVGAAETRAWQTEYVFSEAYSLPRLSVSTLAALWPRVTRDGPDRARFERYFAAGNEAATSFTDQTRIAYGCGIGTVTPSQFVACVARR